MEGGLTLLRNLNYLHGTEPDLQPHADDWPGYAELTTLLADYENTSARIKELEERCRQWGILD